MKNYAIGRRAAALLLTLIMICSLILPTAAAEITDSVQKQVNEITEETVETEETEEGLLTGQKSGTDTESESDATSGISGGEGNGSEALLDGGEMVYTPEDGVQAATVFVTEPKTITLGSSLDVVLPYTPNEEEATLIKFACPKDGFYSISDEKFYRFNGIQYEVYGADANGSIDYASKLYDNYNSSEVYYSNPWYSNSCQAIRMYAGKTYYFVLRNASQYNGTLSETLQLKNRGIQFVVKNNSAVGTGARELTLSFTSNSPYSSFISGYTIGSFEDLCDDYSSYNGSICLTLSPGQSSTISVLAYADTVSWRMAAKYDSYYDVTVDGDIYGDWTLDDEAHSYSMGAAYVLSEDTGETTQFHSISGFTDITAGDHYIFAVKDGDKYYALACDDNRFITKVALETATLTDRSGNTYQGYTLDVTQKDIKESDYVMTCMQPGTFYATYTSATKFKTNCTDPATGKNYALKMGRYGGDMPLNMFDTSSGDISLGKADDFYLLNHSNYAQLSLAHPSDGMPRFTWKYNNGGSNKIIILTDSEGSDEVELKGEQLFRRISAFEIPRNGAGNILIVYHDDDGKHYALTAKGAIPIADPSSEEFPAYYPTPAPTIRADIDYSWVTTSSERQGYYGLDFYYTYFGLKQGDKYFIDSWNPDLTSEYPYGADYPVEVDFLMVKDALTSLDPFTYNPDYQMYADKPCIGAGSFILHWMPETKSFDVDSTTEDAARFEIYVMMPGYSWETYHEVYDLSKIEDWSKILITFGDEDPKKALLYNNYNVSAETVVKTEDEVLPCYSPADDTIIAASMCGLTPGSLISSSKTNFKLSSLTWVDSNVSLYIDGYPKNGSLVSSASKECMFSYTADGNGIVLRGAKNWLHYDETTGELSAVASKDDATPVHVWAIEESGDLIDVVYHTPDNNVMRQLSTARDIDLVQLPDLTNDGEDYIFVGWSTDESKVGFLSLDESCNLYDYDDAADTGCIKAEAAQRLSLLGSCRPEEVDSIDPAEYATDGKLDLYPVYARKSFDSVVTADDSNIRIIGISDWKDVETERPTPGHDEDERWLGKIYCNVYKDGELWVDSEPVYFCYHNDDAADMNLKFISDELLENYNDNAYPLFAYMNDADAYPLTSQEGRYAINAVYASQGGSEDGLKYNYNWITDHGGRLDNVEGGSTISVYVTTLYKVEYFMDDEELTDDTWQNPDYYATPGTDNAVDEKVTQAAYLVKSDNDLHLLMDHSVTDDSAFVDDNIIRGGYSKFMYYIRDYEHVIPVAKLPDAPGGKVLTSSTWAIKDEDGNVLENAAPNSDYGITGTEYGTGNTVNSWIDEDDDEAYTYHLYIYSADYESVAVTLAAQKLLDGKAPSGSDFTFELKDETGKVVQTKNNNGGKIDFNEIVFDTEGTYTYTISEAAGSDARIVYDSTVYTAVITVSKSNGITAQVSYEESGKPVTDVPVFKNTTKKADNTGNTTNTTNSGAHASNGSKPNTGDTCSLLYWLLAAVLSVLAMAVMLFYVLRKGN